MVEITWTEKAKYSLKNIYEYIVLDNPVAAEKVVTEIYKQVDLLNLFPLMGYQFEHASRQNIRILLYGHYRIAYRVNNDSIDILAIIHGSMDISKYFKVYTP